MVHQCAVMLATALSLIVALCVGVLPNGLAAAFWLLVVAALSLGFSWSLSIDAVLKPAIVVVIYVWLAWLMAVPAPLMHCSRP